jgi:hypothetical protein
VPHPSSYKGGRGEALWRLHRLNNIDKHRFLCLCGSKSTAIDAVGHWAQMMPQLKPLAKAGYVFIPSDNSFPLKMGDTLFVTTNTEVDQNLKFSFDIAFGEPGVAYGEPVLECVTCLADIIDELLDNFSPLLL